MKCQRLLVKNRTGKSSLQIKPIILRVRGQEQLPFLKENRIPAWVLLWDPGNFRFWKSYLSSSTVLTCFLVSQDRRLCRGIKWMCCCLTLRQDYRVPSHQHTINKKAPEPEVAVVHVFVSDQAGGQLLHSSGLCCVLGFESLQGKYGQITSLYSEWAKTKGWIGMAILFLKKKKS